MGKKLMKSIFPALMVAAVLGTGTVSARQLSLGVQTTCSGFCDKKKHPCPNILGCGCVIQPGFTSGTCGFIAAKPASRSSGN